MHPYLPRDVRQLRRLLDRIPIGMLVTRTLDGVTHTRPMLMHDIDESGWLWFIMDRDSRNACELNQNPHATITFQSSSGNRYIAVQGTAIVVRDDVGLKELWKSTRRSWLPRADRAKTVLVAMRVTSAEYWLLPRTRLPRVIGAAKALITGKRQESGLHGVLRLHALSA
jgi:general stress protein 26